MGFIPEADATLALHGSLRREYDPDFLSIVRSFSRNQKENPIAYVLFIEIYQ